MNADSTRNQNKLNLTAALRILQSAGVQDPRLLTENPDGQIQLIIDALCDLSIHDGLTGLVNATFFHAVLGREIERSLRTGRTCGLMVIDIDFFKSINDTYGHAVGDQVIQTVARQINSSKRSMDTAARIGGEEFSILLPECMPEDAIQAAKRIHAAVNNISVPIGSAIVTITTSAGLVWTNPDNAVSSLALLADADQEMYRAKRSGRAQLCYKYFESAIVSSQERSSLMAMPYKEEL